MRLIAKAIFFPARLYTSVANHPIVAIPPHPLSGSVVLSDDFFTLIALLENVFVR
jgi:hypothetical protein